MSCASNLPIWYLRLVCCGRDGGVTLHPSWEEADETRQSYVSVEGHERSAILCSIGVTEDE